MDVKKVIDASYYRVLNLITVLYGKIPNHRNIEVARLLKVNAQYRNKYRGQRCFILGNGPSISMEDLSVLEGEHIFTVNQMIRNEKLVKLKPMCNFWFDPVYFDDCMSEEAKDEFEKLFCSTCNCNDKIINFVPVGAYNFLKKRNLSMNRIGFLDASLYYYDGYNKDFDYTKRMVGFQNIVQYATAMAIYMGFSEIYLLGCDSTGIITKINSVLGEGIDACYSYNLSGKSAQYVNTLLEQHPVEKQFTGWARIFHLYAQLYNYCNRRGIKYINCSKTTIIQDLPRRDLESVLHENDAVNSN